MNRYAYRYGPVQRTTGSVPQYTGLRESLERPVRRVIEDLPRHLYPRLPGPDPGLTPPGTLGQVRDFLLRMGPDAMLQAAMVAVDMMIEQEPLWTFGRTKEQRLAEAQMRVPPKMWAQLRRQGAVPSIYGAEGPEAAARRQLVYGLANRVRELVRMGMVLALEPEPADVADRICDELTAMVRSGNVRHIELALEGVADGLLGPVSMWQWGSFKAVFIAALDGFARESPDHSIVYSREADGEDFMSAQDVLINEEELVGVLRHLYGGSRERMDLVEGWYGAIFREGSFVQRWYDRVRVSLPFRDVLTTKGRAVGGVQLVPGGFVDERGESDLYVTLNRMAGWVRVGEWGEFQEAGDSYAYNEALEAAQAQGVQDPQAAAQEVAMEAEQDAIDEAFREWRGDVLGKVEPLLDHFNLQAVPVFGDNSFDFRIRPQQTWWEVLGPLASVISGQGPFYYDSIADFLGAGPYTPRGAVASHLGWVSRYHEVYG